MKTAYAKLASLSFILLAALLLFAPMRSGSEDSLYAYPQSIRMNRGDSCDIKYVLESDDAQAVSYETLDASIAQVTPQGHVTAISAGKTQIRLAASKGAKAVVLVEVVGSPVTSLSLNTESLTLQKGEVSGLKAIFNEDADETLVEWLSADERMARVDAVGRVSAVGGGQTHIIATTPNGLSAAASVSVQVSGDAIRITPDNLTVGTGATLKLETFYLPSDTTDEITKWMSSDTNVVAVESDGTLRAVGEGDAVVSVYTRDGLSASTAVKVERAASDFEIAPSSATVERGDTLCLEPRFMDGAGQVTDQYNGHYIVWHSSDPAVATVEDGEITALKSGTARITAEADGMSASCNVQVQVLVHEVCLDQEEVYLLREQTGTPIQLNAQITPADPDDPTLTYLSDNPLVAVVSETGLVSMTGGYGTAVITATAKSGAQDRFILNVVTSLPVPSSAPPIVASTPPLVSSSYSPETA